MAQKKLGDRIRKFREQKEMTREELAERSGLELSFINALEEDDLYPSLGPLLKIARSLGVRLGTFIDDEVSRDPLIVRLGERKEELSMHHGGRKDASMRFYSLGKGKSDRSMEPFFIEMKPETEENIKLSSHEGEEFIVVMNGQVEFRHAGENYVLEQGDSVYFNSIVPHYVGCHGDEPAQIYAVLYFPE